MPSLRRLRGVLLRLVFARRSAAIVGGVFTATFVILRVVPFTWESWLTDGIGLLLGSTGVALLVAAVGGRRSDWTDPTNTQGVG